MKTYLVLLVTILITGGAAFAHNGHHPDLDANRPATLSGESIYQLGSAWLDENGKAVSLSHFRGKPLVLAMVYTSCHGACPLIVSDMKKIEKALPDAVRPNVQFALFSFDTERDTPLKLTAFAKAHALDLTHWTLLTASANQVRELAAVLGVSYKKERSGDFAHSNVITLVDSEGIIRHQQVGLNQDPKESVQMLASLALRK